MRREANPEAAISEAGPGTLAAHPRSLETTMRTLKLALIAILGFLLGAAAVWWGFPRWGLPLPGIPSADRDIRAVLAHPPFAGVYLCSEHPGGQMAFLGDDLGQDCLMMDFVTRDERTWLMPYQHDGASNDDWFGWRADVLSPCECRVTLIHRNDVVNEPGRPRQSRAASITLQTADGIRFTLAHLREFSIAVGDTVQYGQPLGRVGNNGFSRAPHVHIGAWQGREALQIRWDQHFMAE